MDLTEGPESFTPTFNSSSPSSKEQPLISYIAARDSIPERWNSRKRARYSAGDARDLQLYLERYYDIVRPSVASRRTVSVPPMTQPFRRTYLGSSKTSSRQAWSYCHGMLESAVNFARSAHTITRYIRRYGTFVLRSLLVANVVPAHLVVLRLLRDLLAYSWSLIRKIFSVLKKPLAIVLVALVVMNMFATAYTLTRNSFLDTFCPEKVPFARDMLCRGWDELHFGRDTINPEQRNPNMPFAAYLKDDTSSLSYELPHYLNQLESTIRAFRANLPGSEYSTSNQQELNRQFSEYINQSETTFRLAQEFYSHIMGTIRMHVSDTTWMVQKLNNTSFFSNVTLLIDGPLSQSMAFFESYGMVYLIGGVEPFKQNVLQSTIVQAVQLMQDYVGLLSDRLLDDIKSITALQTSLIDLATSSEVVQRYISQCTAGNNRKCVNQYSTAWAHMAKHLLSQTFTDYQIEQRCQWLDSMRPVFEVAIKHLHEMTSKFQTARSSCLHIGERLKLEGRAARYGWEPSEWTVEQGKEMCDGVDELQFQLTNFHNKKTRFHEDAFPKQLGSLKNVLQIEI